MIYLLTRPIVWLVATIRSIGPTSSTSLTNRFSAPITSGAESNNSSAIASASASCWPLATTRLTKPTS